MCNRYIKEIKKTAKTYGIEVVEVRKTKHLKVYMRKNDFQQYVIFPQTPSNGCWQKGIHWNIKSIFLKNMQKNAEKYLTK